MRSATSSSRAARLEAGDSGDDFREMLASRAPKDDSELADLIDVDGRDRLARGLACELERYRSAVPDLALRPISLDAAIDVSLRSLARQDGAPSPQNRHVEQLLRSNPDLAAPIRVAAVLAEELLSTSGIAGISPRGPSIALPRSIGPALEDGRPRYELVRLLGEGSSGRVYEAVDRLLSDSGHPARVAVKLIAIDPATIQRQTAEATKARRIEHPGVARVLDRGLTGDQDLYLVYELVAGGDLQAWFEARARRLELRVVARMVSDIARGVQAAHSAGLVHCDLKPSNVLISLDGQPRVTDFGVAALTESHASLPIGNLAFAAPEQVKQSKASASPLVDIYALGGLLYFLATGLLPNGSTPEEVVRRHDSNERESGAHSITKVRRDADERLDRICERAMRSKPEDRYATAAELASDLEAWLELRPVGWMHEGLAQRTRLWILRRPGIALLTAACVLLGLGGSFGSGFYAKSAQVEAERAREAEDRNLKGQQGVKDIFAWLENLQIEHQRPTPEDATKHINALIETFKEGDGTKPKKAKPLTPPPDGR